MPLDPHAAGDTGPVRYRTDLAHDARNDLGVALLRVQLLRRRAEAGRSDPAHLPHHLAEVEARLRRVAELVEALDGPPAH